MSCVLFLDETRAYSSAEADEYEVFCLAFFPAKKSVIGRVGSLVLIQGQSVAMAQETRKEGGQELESMAVVVAVCTNRCVRVEHVALAGR